MSMSDPVADMLTRLRNALGAGKLEVELPSSKLKEGVAKVLTEEGYLLGYQTLDLGTKKALRMQLKYTPDGGSVIRGLTRESKPGRRLYCNVADLPRVQNGLGVAILSTPQGVLSDHTCREKRVGGELLCTVW